MNILSLEVYNRQDMMEIYNIYSFELWIRLLLPSLLPQGPITRPWNVQIWILLSTCAAQNPASIIPWFVVSVPVSSAKNIPNALI